MSQTTRDNLELASLGYEPVFSRKFNTWSMLALAFNILGTWMVFAYNLADGLSNGGPVIILWGLCTATAGNLAIAVSLGELCSSMPTAMGQAYWIFRLFDSPWARFLSYLCAWINTFGWSAITASQVAFTTRFMLAIKSMTDPTWPGPWGWLLFVIHLGITLLLTLINAGACRKDYFLPWFNNIVGIQFVALFVAFSLAMLISVGTDSNLRYQSGSFVFGTWLNRTGWPDGVVWFIGLRFSAYGLTAFDCVIHMAEEIPAPRVNIPRVLYLVVLTGAATGALFMVVCLFCIQNVGQALSSPTGLPFTTILTSTVGLNGAVALIAVFEVNSFGQSVSVMTSTSRLIWGVARDGGLPWASCLSHVDASWKAPLRVLCAEGIFIALIGVLYLFSEKALQAVISVSTIALTVSYALPLICLVLVGRDRLPPRKFNLGRWGYLLNVTSIIYCCITTVFFFFPAQPHTSASEMNYAIVVFGAMLVISVIFWFVSGKKSYLVADTAVRRAIQEQNLLPLVEHMRTDIIRHYLEADLSRSAASRLLALWSIDAPPEPIDEIGLPYPRDS